MIVSIQSRFHEHHVIIPVDYWLMSHQSTPTFVYHLPLCQRECVPLTPLKSPVEAILWPLKLECMEGKEARYVSPPLTTTRRYRYTWIRRLGKCRRGPVRLALIVLQESVRYV
jgi:hypothetical protein